MITSKTKIKISLADKDQLQGNLLALTELQELDAARDSFDMTDSIHSVQFARPWLMRLMGLFPSIDPALFPTGQPQVNVFTWQGQFLSMSLNKQTGEYKIGYNTVPLHKLGELTLYVNRENLNRRVVPPIPWVVRMMGRVFG
jgi:hypothetical protein